jgi:hypothetical protein
MSRHSRELDFFKLLSRTRASPPALLDARDDTDGDTDDDTDGDKDGDKMIQIMKQMMI